MGIILLKTKTPAVAPPEPTKPSGKLVLKRKTVVAGPKLSHPFLQPGVSIDHVARFVIMSALLYYRFNTQIMSDEQYDELSIRLVNRWDELNDLRKWQLGSPEEIQSSGFHIKVTLAGASGAASWLYTERRDTIDIYEVLGPPRRWEFAADHGGVSWVRAGG